MKAAPGFRSSSSRLRRLTIMSLAVSLSAVGAFIKVPGPVGSIALDSWPGYLSALALGPDGAVVAFAGHLASALSAGFPLGLVLHLVVAGEMALCALAFRWVSLRAGVVAGAIAAVALNGLVAPVALVPWLGWGLVVSLFLPLSLAAAANVIAASVAYQVIPFWRFTSGPGSRSSKGS